MREICGSEGYQHLDPEVENHDIQDVKQIKNAGSQIQPENSESCRMSVRSAFSAHAAASVKIYQHSQHSCQKDIRCDNRASGKGVKNACRRCCRESVGQFVAHVIGSESVASLIYQVNSCNVDVGMFYSSKTE